MTRRLKLTLAGLVLLLASLGWSAHRVRGRSVPRLGTEDTAAARGSFHVHSDLSHDSELTVAEIVAAAKARELDFVILTDHNEQHAGPMVRDGVVILSAAELSTASGHLIQLGAAAVLDKEARQGADVQHGVRQLGGFPILAHPSDDKRPWAGPTGGAAGLEIANLAASTRRRGGAAFVGLVLPFAAQPLNPELALAQLYDRDTEALERFDAEHDPRFIGLCGADAHGWLDLEQNLRAWQVVLDAPMPLPEEERAAFVLKEITEGRFFCHAGLFGGPPRFRFEVQRAEAVAAGPGGEVIAGADLMLVVSAPAAAQGAQSVVLFKDGEAVARTEHQELRYPTPAPGTYRAEVWLSVPGLLFGEEQVPAIYSGRLRVVPPPDLHGPEASVQP